MPKELDIEWLLSQAVDNKSKEWILKIFQWRKFVLENNKFIPGDKFFLVNLGKYKIWFKKNCAFSSIETYNEIFKENAHFLVPAFSGLDAKVVVDLGANEGFYALKIKENNSTCKVICVEPNPYAFEILKKNVKTNFLKDVILINKAIGVNGRMPFEIVKEVTAIGGKSLSIVPRAWLKKEFIEQIYVETITLEKLCEEYNVDNIDILKIDVEGMELEILKNEKNVLNIVDKIVVERHSKEVGNKIVDFLTKCGFKLVYEEECGVKKYYGDLYFIKK